MNTGTKRPPRDNRNRVEPNWGRCHRRFAFKARGPALSPGTSVWPARIRSPAGRPDARRALALFITNSRIPNSKWTSVQVSFLLLPFFLFFLLLHPPLLPPLCRSFSSSFSFNFVSRFVSSLPSLNRERIQAVHAHLQCRNDTNHTNITLAVQLCRTY